MFISSRKKIIVQNIDWQPCVYVYRHVTSECSSVTENLVHLNKILARYLENWDRETEDGLGSRNGNAAEWAKNMQ